MSSCSRWYRRKAKSDRTEISMTKDVVYTERKEENVEIGELLSGTSQLSDED